MRNLLALLAAAVLAFAIVGYYLNWYKVQSDPAPTGHHNVSIDINKAKIAEDVGKGVKKGEEKLEGVLEKDGNKANDPGKTATPPTTGNQAPQE
jgi:hypothetical protein